MNDPLLSYLALTLVLLAVAAWWAWDEIGFLIQAAGL